MVEPPTSRLAQAFFAFRLRGYVRLMRGLLKPCRPVPAEQEPAPSAAALADAGRRIATGGASVRAGRNAFADQGCDRCHSIAAIDADGRLGPRLDRVDEDADDIVESIVQPGEDTADGYSAELMPTDYGERMASREIRALAAFIAAAAGAAEDLDDRSGKGGEGSGHGGEDPSRGRERNDER